MESQIQVVDTRPDRSKEYHPPKPILDRLLVRKLQDGDTTGFVIPDKYRQQTRRGVVLAIGDGVILGGQFVDMKDFVNVGDIVFYGEYTAEILNKDDENTVIIRLQDVRTVERVRE